MSNELEGKVAVVTGGASGLGEGLSRRFAAEGAKVLIGDIDRDAGAALAKEIGANARFVEADVADLDRVSGLVSTAVEQFGGLHVMVNNAGVSGTMHRSLFDDDLADFDKVMRVNLRAVMAGTRDAARHMRDAGGGGSIINITSIGGILAGGGVMTYRRLRRRRRLRIPTHRTAAACHGRGRITGESHCDQVGVNDDCKHNNGRRPARRRTGRNAAGELVDGTGAALLPGICRATGRPHPVLQRPRARSADVRAKRTGAHTRGAGTGLRPA